MEKLDFDLKKGKEDGKVSAKESLEIGLQLVKIIDQMKSAGTFHRDLKPQNVLLKKQNGKWEIKLTDFALADPYTAYNSTTRAISGTPGFAPVMLDNPAQGGDDHSLAVTLGSILMEEKSFWNGFFKTQKTDRCIKLLRNHPKKYYQLVGELIYYLLNGMVSHVHFMIDS